MIHYRRPKEGYGPGPASRTREPNGSRRLGIGRLVVSMWLGPFAGADEVCGDYGELPVGML